MHWLLIALIAPSLWAASNHIDKHLLEKQIAHGGVGALMIFSALVGVFAIPAILLFGPPVLAISPLNGALITLNGILYVVSLMPYYYALERDETSIVVPLFQISAIFSYALGLAFLGEQLSWGQMLAALLIIGGSVMLTLELGRQRLRIKASVLALMLVAALLNALNWFLFKFVAIQAQFLVTSFWEYIGFTLVGLFMLIFIRPYRAAFVAVLRTNTRNVLGLVALNEALSAVAKTATNLASMTAPLALISTVHGLQPLFAFIYGIVLTLYLPRYGSERIGGAIIAQKLAALALITAGTYILAA